MKAFEYRANKMFKAIAFVIGCSAITLLAAMLTLFVGNGARFMEVQNHASADGLWKLALGGAVAGAIIAIANLLGPFPRIAWRKIAIIYSAFPSGIALLMIAPLLITRIAEGSRSSHHFLYFAVGPGDEVLPLIVTSAIAVWVIRTRKGLAIDR